MRKEKFQSPCCLEISMKPTGKRTLETQARISKQPQFAEKLRALQPKLSGESLSGRLAVEDLPTSEREMGGRR
jgi:hypothetical protein